MSSQDEKSCPHQPTCDKVIAELLERIQILGDERNEARRELATARTEVERLTCDVETFKREAVHHRKRAIEAGAEGKSFDELVDATANESVDDHNKRVEGLYRETFEEES